MKKPKLIWLLFSSGLLAILIMLPGPLIAQQNIPEIVDVTIRNISNTAESSTQPFLVADKAGNVHLFWSEDVGGTVTGGTNIGNTLMYSRWDGVSWSQPVDVLLTPSEDMAGLNDPSALQPHAVIDDQGVIHLIWMGRSPAELYYSFAKATEAGSGLAWAPGEMLALDLTGTEFSVDIKYEPPSTLYVVFARVTAVEQYAGSNPRTLSFIKSTDSGATWSEPVDIASVPDLERGFSAVRLLVVPDGKLLASYTEWDLSGNGQAVYVVRSLDGGETWDNPVQLAAVEPNDYERDWVRLAWLEGNRLVATWEGGYRAYRQFMYSDDLGATWSEPEDLFYWLIGENGFTEFVRDGDGRLHLFVAQRTREGSIGRYGCLGLWHSVWQGEREWSDPELVGGCNNMVDPRVVIVNGNEVIAAWYSSLVGEIITLRGRITNTSYIDPQPLPVAENITSEASQFQSTIAETLIAESTRPPLPFSSVEAPPVSNQIGTALFWSVIASITLIGIIVATKYGLSRH